MYDEKMSFTADEFYKLIETVCKKVVLDMFKSKGVETTHNCKVVQIYEPEGNTDPFAQTVSIVYMGNENTVVDGVRNNSNQMLKVGDKAIVYAIKDSLSNAYIGQKYN